MARSWGFAGLRLTLSLGLCAPVVACSDPPVVPDDPEPGTGVGGDPFAGSGGGTVGPPGTATPPEPGAPPPPPTRDDSPEIELWYGSEQVFGGPGRGVPQRWVNVMGRIVDPTVNSCAYRVNGGAEVPCSLGPTTTRLLGTGDFNLEVARDELVPYPAYNVLEIEAGTGSGETLYRRALLRVHPDAGIAPDLTIDFSTLSDVEQINEVAAVVDGLWHLTETGIRTTEFGYDRLLALGSQSWQGNYEVLAEFVVHHYRNWGGIGLAVGWQGHLGEQDPREEWPLEALGWVRFVAGQPELQLMTYGQGVLTRRDYDLDTGAPYLLRLRTEDAGANPTVSIKLWREDEAEPSAWQLSTPAPPHDGSVLLVTHHAEATWRTVQVTPLP